MFACSGPGAGAAIAESIRISQIHAVVLALMLLVSAGLSRLNGKRVVTLVLLALLAIHPAWTVSALVGDCGHLKQCAVWFVTVAASLALIWQVAHLDPLNRSGNPPSAPPP